MHVQREPSSTTRRFLAALFLVAAAAFMFWSLFGDAPEDVVSLVLGLAVLIWGVSEVRKAESRFEKRLAVALIFFSSLMIIGALVNLI